MAMPLRDITLPSIHQLAITRHHVTSPLANAKIGGCDRPGGLIILPSKKTPSFVTPPESPIHLLRIKHDARSKEVSVKSWLSSLTLLLMILTSSERKTFRLVEAH
eukprot:scaffold2720_cov181-Alexandrium_tamarense.AAC.2